MDVNVCVCTQVAILEHAGGSEPGELDLGSQHPSFMTDHTVQQVGIPILQ